SSITLMAQIFLLSIGSMSIAYHFVTTTIWAIHCYCYHMNFYLSTNLCSPVYHNLPKFTTTHVRGLGSRRFPSRPTDRDPGHRLRSERPRPTWSRRLATRR